MSVKGDATTTATAMSKETNTQQNKHKNSLQTPLGSFPCPTKHSLREIVFSKLMSLSQWEITHREYI